MIFMPLTIKQQKFVDAYIATSGNGAESADVRGIKAAKKHLELSPRRT